MITSVDSNVLIDVIGRENEFTAAAIEALNGCLKSGGLIICPVVAAEIADWFDAAEQMNSTLADMQIDLRAFGWEDLYQAGREFVVYRQRSSQPKNRMLADFLIAAHAKMHADALLTRDRGYYKTYFPTLRLIQPGAPSHI
jgi:predicted nucleic acid-binding protein